MACFVFPKRCNAIENQRSRRTINPKLFRAVVEPASMITRSGSSPTRKQICICEAFRFFDGIFSSRSCAMKLKPVLGRIATSCCDIHSPLILSNIALSDEGIVWTKTHALRALLQSIDGHSSIFYRRRAIHEIRVYGAENRVGPIFL